MSGSMPKILAAAAVMIMGLSAVFVSNAPQSTEQTQVPVHSGFVPEKQSQNTIDPYSAASDTPETNGDSYEGGNEFGEPMVDANQPDYANDPQADEEISAAAEDSALQLSTQVMELHESPMTIGVEKPNPNATMAY